MTSTSNLEEQERNWLDLPSDVTTDILNRIGMIDILENVQKVCTDWHNICKDPALWRVINMNDLLNSTSKLSTSKIICKHVVDRSQGQLVDIALINATNVSLLPYVADRSSQLRRLEMASCLTDQVSLSTDALMKFPLLEELNFYAVKISKEEIETTGRYCPLLKTLKVNERSCCLQMRENDENSLMHLNKLAIATGQNLVELRHLELIGNRMTTFGLQVILDNCHHLETLDLRACFNIDLKGDVWKKCLKQIKYLQQPYDSFEGCPYFYGTDGESSDEDCNQFGANNDGYDSSEFFIRLF